MLVILKKQSDGFVFILALLTLMEIDSLQQLQLDTAHVRV